MYKNAKLGNKVTYGNGKDKIRPEKYDSSYNVDNLRSRTKNAVESVIAGVRSSSEWGTRAIDESGTRPVD
jgi:hypothetical protein